jgi:hypothetical protein
VAFSDWRRNVSLDGKVKRASENIGGEEEQKRNVSKCLILGVFFRTKDLFNTGCSGDWRGKPREHGPQYKC